MLNKHIPPIRRKASQSAKLIQQPRGSKDKAQVVQLASKKVLGCRGQFLDVTFVGTKEDVESEGITDAESQMTSGDDSENEDAEDTNSIIYEFGTDDSN